MKHYILILLLPTVVLSEVPPQRRFISPQTSYGPPKKQISFELLRNQLAAKIVSSKLTIEQLIRLTEQLSAQQSTQVPSVPHSSYGVPNKVQVTPRPVQQSNNFGVVPQKTYGVPSTSYGVPNNNNNDGEQFGRICQHQNINQRLPVFPAQNFKSTGQQSQEINEYNTIDPILRDIENENRFKNAFSKQFLPVKGPSDFNKGQSNFNFAFNNNNNNRYVPPRENEHTSDSFDIRPGNVRQLNVESNLNFENSRRPNTNINQQNVDERQRYLPPSTTRRPFRPIASTTPLVQVPASTERPNDINNDNEEATEVPTNVNSNVGGNTNIATAVAGGNVYYLHPDGRLQRVVLEFPQQDIGSEKNQVYLQNLQNAQNVQNLQSLQNLQHSQLQALQNTFVTPYYTLA